MSNNVLKFLILKINISNHYLVKKNVAIDDKNAATLPTHPILYDHSYQA